MNPPVIVEQTLPVSIERVWRAITYKDQMKEWYFDIKEFNPVPGFSFAFISGPDIDRQYLHQCEMVEVMPEQRIRYTWPYKGHEGNSVITFKLCQEKVHTWIKVTHEGCDSFPDQRGDFTHENYEAGWTDLTGSSLQQFLNQHDERIHGE